jgi:hypothetical protein
LACFGIELGFSAVADSPVMDDSEVGEGDGPGAWEAAGAGSESEVDGCGLVAFSQLIRRIASKPTANNAGNLSGNVFLTGPPAENLGELYRRVYSQCDRKSWRNTVTAQGFLRGHP